jgi:hypothetical protein
VNALAQQDEELADEVIAFDDEVDRCYFGIETNIQSLSGEAGSGGTGSPARARDPARQPAPRAHGRLLRDRGETDEARPRRAARTPR